MNITYRRLIEFINDANEYIRLHPENTKLGYALNKTVRKAVRLYQDFNEKIEDLRVQFSLTGKSEEILRDEQGRYQFSKEGLTNFNKANRELADTEVDLEVHKVEDAPAELEDKFRAAFEDIIL